MNIFIKKSQWIHVQEKDTDCQTDMKRYESESYPIKTQAYSIKRSIKRKKK